MSERYRLAADALFAFDQSGRDDIRAEGRAKLDIFARKLKLLDKLEAIGLRGHTDRLGGEVHNLPLSLRRVTSVKANLVNLGVPADLIQVEGKGSASPVKECGDKDIRHLCACLQPNRRVEIELRGLVAR